MSKTYELRKIIQPLLRQSLGEAYYEDASSDAAYPYKVWELTNIDLDDMSRDDIILIVNVWSDNAKEADEVADEIEKTLNGLNAPKGDSYPTFYRMGRIRVPDEDKNIKHRELKFNIQNYYIGA